MTLELVPGGDVNLVGCALVAALGVAAGRVMGLTAVCVGWPSLARNAPLLGAAMAAMLAIGWGTLLLGASELPEAFRGIDTPWTPMQGWATLAVEFYLAVSWTAGIAFALGARKGDPAAQAQAALMSSALILYPAVYWGGFFPSPSWRSKARSWRSPRAPSPSPRRGCGSPGKALARRSAATLRCSPSSSSSPPCSSASPPRRPDSPAS